MTKWKLNRFTMNEDVYIEERPSGAAPLGSRAFYEKAHPYWIQQAKNRPIKKKPQASSLKRQAAGGVGGPASGKFLIDK